MMNEATIGRFAWNGKQVGEVCAPLGKSLDSENDVMEAAIATIMAGEVD